MPIRESIRKTTQTRRFKPFFRGRGRRDLVLRTPLAVPEKTIGRCAPVLGFFDRGANPVALLPPRRRAPALPGTSRVQSFLLYKPYEKDIFALLAVRVELSNSQKVGSDSEPS